MTCSIAVENVFGPVVSDTCHHGFDFTLLFEEIFFCIARVIILSIPIPIRLFQLLPRKTVTKKDGFYWTKTIVHVCFIILQFIKLIILVIPGYVPKTRASIAATALLLYLSIVLLVLSHFEHLKSVRPSALLSLYFGVAILFDIVRARTLWTITDMTPFAIVFSVMLGFEVALFILESLEKGSGYKQYPEQLASETAGNVFTRGLFWWLNPLLLKGYKSVLDVDALPTIDNELTAPQLHRKIWARWNNLPVKTPGTLLKLLISEYWYFIFQGAIPRLALSGFTFAQPFLITRVVSFAVDPVVRLDSQLGDGLIAATALIYIGLAVSLANSQHKTYRVITRLRGTFISLICFKTLNIDVPTAQESAALTLMSADVERMGTGLRIMHEIWASPIDIGLAIYLLTRQIGASAAAPGVLFLLCSAIGLKVAASMGERQRLWLEGIEKRIKATSDMLSSMKEVRMGGMQDRMEQELKELRQKEILSSRKFKNALALIVCLSYTTAAMAPVFSFGIFSFFAKKNHTTPLTTEIGFTALSIFALLRSPMSMLLDALAGVVSSIGAMQRIGEYLVTPSHLPPYENIALNYPPPYEVEKPGVAYSYESVSSRSSSGAVQAPQISNDPRTVIATRYNAGWIKDRAFVIRDLSFSIMRGSLTFIVGPVGSGKSTLLQALLGETTVNSGSLHTSFNHAGYASQTPWLVNDTLRKNILGMNPFDPVWYSQVIDACELRNDISRFANGDGEVVDASGSNLSGGQQARVGVARAVYSKQPVMIFDDVMSGLDARTENSLFNNLLGPNGLLRKGGITVIFATNALHRLSAGDHILVLGPDGKLFEQGSYPELSTAGKHGQSSSPDFSEFENVAIQPLDAEMRGLVNNLAAEGVTGSQRRDGDLTIYKYYAKTVGYLNFAIFIGFGALFAFCLLFPQYVVKWWAQSNETHPDSGLLVYVGGYFALGVVAILSLAGGCLTLVSRMMPRASSTFHNTLLQTTLNAPLSLFSGNSVGDTLNRFSQDLQLIDMELPLALFNTMIELLASIGQFIMIATSAKYIGATMPAVLIVFFIVQKFYLRTARQVRLLDIEAKGPLFSSFMDTLSGIATIRAFGWQAQYEQRCQDRLFYSQRPFYLLYSIQRWLNLVLDFIVAGIAIIVVSIATKTKGDIDPGLIGVALVNIVSFSVSIKALLENWTNLETCIGAVSRVRTFAATTKSEHKPNEIDEPPPHWPAEGLVDYDNVTATWDGKDKPVITDLTLSAEPGKKLAICGRSGSGKSSLVSALFRLLEPDEGAITIDGVDLTTLRRGEIRNRLICVTQAPFLMPQTVRENIDPFHVAGDDDDIKHALRQVQMLEIIEELGGLDATIDNDRMSVGQKQLLCLARATLRPGSILVLDEATASLDIDTDEIVQKVIRTAFKEHTIIAIAHRLQTIIDFDNVAVISDGKLAEYGPPQELLQDEESTFAKLYRVSAGHTKIERAKSRARARHRRRSSHGMSRVLSIMSTGSMRKQRESVLSVGGSMRKGSASLQVPQPDRKSVSFDTDTNLHHEDFADWIRGNDFYDHAYHNEEEEDGAVGDLPHMSASIRDVAPVYEPTPITPTTATPSKATSMRQMIDEALMEYAGPTRKTSVNSTRYGGLERLAEARRRQMERERREQERRWNERLSRFPSLSRRGGEDDGDEEEEEGEAERSGNASQAAADQSGSDVPRIRFN